VKRRFAAKLESATIVVALSMVASLVPIVLGDWLQLGEATATSAVDGLTAVT
jgi:hypothetical protein